MKQDSERPVHESVGATERQLDENQVVEQALDLAAFRQEVFEGIRWMAGAGHVRDIFDEDTET